MPQPGSSADPEPVRLPERVPGKDQPVKNTFIQFNEFSPAMLHVNNTKSTPGFRYRDTSFGVDDDEGSPDSQGVQGTMSYATDPLSPAGGGDPVMARTSSAKDEPAKIEAMSSLRGASGMLWTHLETGDTDGKAKHMGRFDGGDDECGPLKAASMLSMRSVRFDDPDDTPIATINAPMAVFIDEDRVPFSEGMMATSSGMMATSSSTKARKKKSSKQLRDLPSPQKIETKHGFVHYDEMKPNFSIGATVGHASSAPPKVMGGLEKSPCSNDNESSGEEFLSDSGESTAGSWCSVASAASVETAQVVVWRGLGLDRNAFLPQEEMAGQEAMRFSQLLQCRRTDGQLYNLGAQLHEEGRCVPCLMQCRFVGNRCTEPCRFGLLCNRCHEPHTEEELQKIQAQMRRLRKNKGSQRPS